MIITLEEAQKHYKGITQEDLDGIEEAIRRETSNNFQNINIRLQNGVRFEQDTVKSYDETIGFSVGATIQVNDSKYNDGLYIVESLVTDSIKVKNKDGAQPFISCNAPRAIVTLVEYPTDIKSGVTKLLKYEAKMGDKIGLKSRTVGRMSESYFDMNATESLEGYPIALMKFINKYRKMRWS